MQAASLPLSAGWFWIKAGFELFRRQPMTMFTWAVTLGFLLLMASAIPPIGPIFFIVLMPSVTVMTLHACREIAAGRKVTPVQLFSALKAPKLFRKLIAMGGVYVLSVTVVGILIFMPFMSDIRTVFEGTKDLSMGDVMNAMATPLMLFGLAYVTIAALFWHAPALAAWHGMSLGKALFFSGIACWRNKGAFIIYGVCWFVIALALNLFGELLLAIGLPESLASLIQMPISFIVAATLYCSFYPTYTTVFHTPDDVGIEQGV
ncbi:hypothetical protein FXN63_16985 [Pigmentiphaga aceris]|uniref:DUF2189 domain-containing protein n=1 Tax=Pigmentiphaga aceris TaxID=1940612 RepID=A0A5C0AY08_9BURK|nr:BPSS1780 family membrane protein [Pigmentiphaga aceris]QEI07349.1 hypothetical protein FXN63_16985 [Pigmentiphaga aceris]